MTLEGKANGILAALRSISQHDDAPIEMVRAALASVQRMIDDELAVLEEGREHRAQRRAALEEERRIARAEAMKAG